MYYFVERSIALVRPKEPFLNWVNTSLYDLEVELTLDNMRLDCNSYLIQEVGELEDGINFVDENFAKIFELEFSTWTEDKTTWPTEPLTLKMFWEWFDVEISSTVIDITETADDNDEEEDETPANTLH